MTILPNLAPASDLVTEAAPFSLRVFAKVALVVCLSGVNQAPLHILDPLLTASKAATSSLCSQPVSLVVLSISGKAQRLAAETSR